MAAQTWTPEYAESVVEQLQWSLDADASSHLYEVECERWEIELGENPGFHMALAAEGAGNQFVTVRSQWAYRTFPSVRKLVDDAIVLHPQTAEGLIA